MVTIGVIRLSKTDPMLQTPLLTTDHYPYSTPTNPLTTTPYIYIFNVINYASVIYVYLILLFSFSLIMYIMLMLIVNIYFSVTGPYRLHVIHESEMTV